MAIIKDRPPASRLKQLGWFIAIWALSVLALGLVGGAIKLVLRG
jgi:hypothetical protein